MTDLRLLLIDDHAVLRSGLKLLLESEAGWTVVGEAAAPDEGLELARKLEPDVIILDLRLGRASGDDIISLLCALPNEPRVVVLTAVHDHVTHVHAVSNGAAGIVLKDFAGDVLIEAVQAVAGGAVWLDSTVTADVLKRLRAGLPGAENEELKKIKELTPREREVIKLVCEGLHNPQIAKRLYISEATVRHHLTSIFAKLQLADKIELIIYAFRQELASLPRRDD